MMKKFKRQNKSNTILLSEGLKFSKLTYLIAKKITFSGDFISLNGVNYYQHDKTAMVDFEVFSQPCATNFIGDLDFNEFVAA